MIYKAKHDVAFNVGKEQNTIETGEKINVTIKSREEVTIECKHGKKDFNNLYLLAFEPVPKGV
jgi:hypothetical protein